MQEQMCVFIKSTRWL